MQALTLVNELCRARSCASLSRTWTCCCRSCPPRTGSAVKPFLLSWDARGHAMPAVRCRASSCASSTQTWTCCCWSCRRPFRPPSSPSCWAGTPQATPRRAPPSASTTPTAARAPSLSPSARALCRDPSPLVCFKISSLCARLLQHRRWHPSVLVLPHAAPSALIRRCMSVQSLGAVLTECADESVRLVVSHFSALPRFGRASATIS